MLILFNNGNHIQFPHTIELFYWKIVYTDAYIKTTISLLFIRVFFFCLRKNIQIDAKSFVLFLPHVLIRVLAYWLTVISLSNVIIFLFDTTVVKWNVWKWMFCDGLAMLWNKNQIAFCVVLHFPLTTPFPSFNDNNDYYYYTLTLPLLWEHSYARHQHTEIKQIYAYYFPFFN